jgi:cytochrome P450
MNIWNVHRNEAIFPDAETFNPARWLFGDAGKLEKYLVPFGSGSRMCIGMK